MPTEKTVSVQEAADWIKNNKDLYLLDVREVHEYEQGHIADATLLPLSFLKTMPFSGTPQGTACSVVKPEESLPEQEKYLKALPNNKEQKILCYCRRGGRSLQATDILRYAGFANTYSMNGGIEEWDETER